MMYLIKGNENYFIDSKIEEIKSELAKKNKSLKVISFFEHANFEDIIVAISNIDIFSTNKLIIFKNMDFLNEKTKINKNIFIKPHIKSQISSWQFYKIWYNIVIITLRVNLWL